jgi:hypothetical protein
MANLPNVTLLHILYLGKPFWSFGQHTEGAGWKFDDPAVLKQADPDDEDSSPMWHFPSGGTPIARSLDLLWAVSRAFRNSVRSIQALMRPDRDVVIGDYCQDGNYPMAALPLTDIRFAAERPNSCYLPPGTTNLIFVGCDYKNLGSTSSVHGCEIRHPGFNGRIPNGIQTVTLCAGCEVRPGGMMPPSLHTLLLGPRYNVPLPKLCEGVAGVTLVVPENGGFVQSVPPWITRVEAPGSKYVPVGYHSAIVDKAVARVEEWMEVGPASKWDLHSTTTPCLREFMETMLNAYAKEYMRHKKGYTLVSVSTVVGLLLDTSLVLLSRWREADGSVPITEHNVLTLVTLCIMLAAKMHCDFAPCNTNWWIKQAGFYKGDILSRTAIRRSKVNMTLLMREINGFVRKLSDELQAKFGLIGDNDDYDDWSVATSVNVKRLLETDIPACVGPVDAVVVETLETKLGELKLKELEYMRLLSKAREEHCCGTDFRFFEMEFLRIIQWNCAVQPADLEAMKESAKRRRLK